MGEPLRIGYFNQDFPPEVGAGPARVLELALRWRAAGCEVTVVTGMPNRRMPGRPDGAIHPDYRGRLFMEEDWQGIRVLRSWLHTSSNRSVAHTAANNASFMVTSALHSLWRLGPLDVIIASSPPLLAQVTGEVARRLRSVPMVLEIRDLWPDYMVDMGVLKNRAARKALFGLERYLLRRATGMVVVTEAFRTRIVEKGVPRERVHLVPNGVDLERYHREEVAALPEFRRKDGEFLVGYVGTFGISQDLRSVVDAAAILQEADTDVRFVMVGDGKEKPLIEARARELGLRNLSIHPPVPRDATRAVYNAFDLCLVPLAPIPALEDAVPSKLFEIMACERPLLASVAGETARLVAKSGGAFVTPPGDAEGIARGILHVLRMGQGERAEMGRRGRRYVAEHHDRDELANRYLEILRRIASSRENDGISGAEPSAP